MAGDVVLRPAAPPDADDIAEIMQASRHSHAWMPVLHTPAEYRTFVREHVLARHVAVATIAQTAIGFIAREGEWIEHLYIRPQWTGRGVGGRLLDHVAGGMPVARLYCFQANDGARRFYEKRGFTAEAYGDGSANEEKLPDILYVRRQSAASTA